MWTARFAAAVLAVTAVAVIVGVVLWNSEKSQTLSPDASGKEGWALGPKDAPVVITTFPDFT